MQVSLVSQQESPFNVSIAAARTCYSEKGIVTPEEAGSKPELSNRIASSTFKAGHHTVYQHAHFQFAIKGVTRFAVWDFFHNHPYYNSEQQSYRYAKITKDNYYIPLFKKESSRLLYVEWIDKAQDYYNSLCSSLKDAVDELYSERFPGRANSNTVSNAKRRLVQEVARYVLPISLKTDLYHTISLITLIRYYRYCHHFDTRSEITAIVQEMKSLVVKLDPSLEQFFTRSETKRSYSSLPSCAEWVQLVSSHNLDQVKKEQIDYSLLSESVNPSSLVQANKHLSHVSFTFDKQTSFICDSQAQRHRTSQRSSTRLATLIFGNNDYTTPTLIEHAEFSKPYHQIIKSNMKVIKQLLADESPELVAYLLPHAYNTRVRETTSLLDLIHKHKMRLCYNSQEEFWSSCLREKELITQASADAGDLLQPPCVFNDRAEVRPKCPEGDRFCGITVWKQPAEDWERVI